ncbi:hypothetical protein [Nocardia vaccinii]|uniref:hypothetical protein n=1 Tax=Nocardia vaccinii TaxID=1822 RepID=UPI00083044E2|nr:hypothetical protein [Nocardia vaccinii]
MAVESIEAFLEEFPVLSAQKVATSTTLNGVMKTAAAAARPTSAASDPVSKLASTVMKLYQNVFFAPTQQGSNNLGLGGEHLGPVSMQYAMSDTSGSAAVAAERPGGI